MIRIFTTLKGQFIFISVVHTLLPMLSHYHPSRPDHFCRLKSHPSYGPALVSQINMIWHRLPLTHIPSFLFPATHTPLVATIGIIFNHQL
jgi:hypothetical protein